MSRHEVIEISESEDELDLLTPATPTLVGSSSATPVLSDSEDTSTPGRVLRKRKYNDAFSSRKITNPHFLKRNKVNQPASQGDGTGERGGKKEDRKAHTIIINSKKVAVEAARRRWLLRHQDFFLPLLPHSNNFFNTLQTELQDSTEKGKYIPLHELDEQPSLVEGGQMKDYQLHGLSFLAWMYHNGMNCILGDEMGLGKTLQTLSLFAYIKEHSNGHIDPHLILCPLSVVETWIKEINRWLPGFRVLRFHAQHTERGRIKYEVRMGSIEFDICVTTYENYVAEDNWFKSRRWTYFVLDEGHRIKNSGTILASKVQGGSSLYKLILTGTPIQNNLVELWGLLRWLYPTIFTASSERLFKDSFDLQNGRYSLPFLSSAEKLLSVIMLRRTKNTVSIDVPTREELTVFIPMTEAQRFWTYRLLTRLDTAELQDVFSVKHDDNEGEGSQEGADAKVKDTKTGEQNRWKKLMNLLMQLRKVCNHPYLLPGAEPTPFAIGEHLVASSSKLVLVDKLLKDLLPKGERVLIFSQWTNMLDLLEDFMELRGTPYARLDGSTARPRRTLEIKLFQQEKSPYQVFLISTKAGGLGINLTKASTVIMFDSDWNPQNDLQAIARAHRIGQTKTVKVYRLICQGSVEDQMLDRLRRKLFLSLKIMGSDNSNPDKETAAMKTNEVMDILRKGSSALSRTDNGLKLSDFVNAPIGHILQLSRERDGARAAKLNKELGNGSKEEDEERLLMDAEEEEKKLLTGVAQVQSRLFEGKVVQRTRGNKDIANEWQELQKRARQNRFIVVDGYEVLAELLGPEAATNPARAQVKKAGRKFESEDWCIYCRDGGELVICGTCPRVFHPECQGLSKAAVNAMKGPVVCPQHNCSECGRSTTDCGGMLFRCQTCPLAFCEDCLPQGDLDAVGDTLPEFLLLGYGFKSTAYYVRCHHCHERFRTDPLYWHQWQEEMRETEKKLTKLRA